MCRLPCPSPICSAVLHQGSVSKHGDSSASPVHTHPHTQVFFVFSLAPVDAGRLNAHKLTLRGKIHTLTGRHVNRECVNRRGGGKGKERQGGTWNESAREPAWSPSTDLQPVTAYTATPLHWTGLHGTTAAAWGSKQPHIISNHIHNLHLSSHTTSKPLLSGFCPHSRSHEHTMTFTSVNFLPVIWWEREREREQMKAAEERSGVSTNLYLPRSRVPVQWHPAQRLTAVKD